MHIMIIPLVRRDRPRVQAHLQHLACADRSLRFAAGLVTDDTISRYVDALNFEHDLLLGHVSLCGRVIALVHGAVFMLQGQRHVEAAFSVDAEWRGQGMGRQLMRAVLARTETTGGGTLVGRCSARNRPMRRLFEQAQCTLTREDDELAARRVLDDAGPGQPKRPCRCQPSAALSAAPAATAAGSRVR